MLFQCRDTSNENQQETFFTLALFRPLLTLWFEKKEQCTIYFLLHHNGFQTPVKCFFMKNIFRVTLQSKIRIIHFVRAQNFVHVRVRVPIRR